MVRRPPLAPAGAIASPPAAPRPERDFPPAGLSLAAVRRLRRPPARILSAFARAGEPLILCGVLDDWAALERWSPESLAERIGDLRVQTYVIPRGQVLLDRRTGFRFHEMSVREYVAHVRSGAEPSYYLRAPLEIMPEAMRAEAPAPSHCAGATRLRRNLWFSAPGTVSRLHFDLPHNLIAQVHGRKRFILYPARERQNLYPFPLLSSVPHLSQVDLEDPDLRCFPGLARARGWHCELAPGDLLFMPSRMWHHAHSVDASITVNHWWPPPSMLPLSIASDLYKRARGLNI